MITSVIAFSGANTTHPVGLYDRLGGEGSGARGARTSTIQDQYRPLLWSRQAVAFTLKVALTRHKTSARIGSYGHAKERTKG